jgi:hypothetical protein
LTCLQPYFYRLLMSFPCSQLPWSWLVLIYRLWRPR